MSELLDKAVEAIKTMPLEDQDRISWEIIERIEDKTEWDRIISSTEARNWLKKEGAWAIREYKKLSKGLSLSFISIPRDHMLRESPYWNHFDELPDDIKALAETNYRHWKENRNHPGLRFKQIHPTEPIFSFRVGMKHRTIGVEADDGKIAWFWVGSFDGFKGLIMGAA